MFKRQTYRKVFSKALRVWLDPEGNKHIFVELQANKGQEGGVPFEIELDQEEVTLLIRKLGAARRAQPVNGEPVKAPTKNKVVVNIGISRTGERKKIEFKNLPGTSLEVAEGEGELHRAVRAYVTEKYPGWMVAGYILVEDLPKPAETYRLRPLPARNKPMVKRHPV
jgi:hypothetical protein